MKTSTFEQLMTPEQVAELLHVTVSWVVEHCSRRRPSLPHFRLGKQLRFDRNRIQDFLVEFAHGTPEGDASQGNTY